MKGIKAKVVVIPSDFRLLNYIQSKDCMCYIETGVTNENATIEMRFTTCDDSSVDCLWCSRTDLQANSFTAFLTNGIIRYDIGDAHLDSLAYKDNTDYVIKADNGRMWMDGTKVIDVTPAVFTEYNYITLLDSRIGSGAPTLSDNNNANIKLKGCRIYKSNQLVRDFIPALNSNGVAGLLDTVNSKFYVSPNGMAFNYGLQKKTIALHNVKLELSDHPTDYVDYQGGVIRKALVIMLSSSCRKEVAA